jgi:hypothetical protein
MKCVIESRVFPFEVGSRLLKLKYDKCPDDFVELKDIWDTIEPMDFGDIITMSGNVEDRRVALSCYGIERLVKNVRPTLLDSQSITKKTTWVDSDGVLQEKEYVDTYELYSVAGSHLHLRDSDTYTYVSCKDTSTDRQYLLWVDAGNIARVNNVRNPWITPEKYINAVQAIAWTIQTTLAMGSIKKIIRQGDCILVKPTKNPSLVDVRHLTENEYRTLLVAES